MRQAHVRLTTPQGETVVVRADGEGRWTMPLAASAETRIYGLSLTSHKRLAQAEGYLLIGPQGQAAMLRAGAGAIRLDGGKGLRLSSVDFDRAGGAVVSGEAPPSSPVILHRDGSEAAQGRASAQGRFSISLPTPMPAGAHQLQIFGDGASDTAQVTVSPADPPVGAPIRSAIGPEGLRVDWMTPGGGLQSTLLTP